MYSTIRNYLTYMFHYLVQVWASPQQTSWVQPETGSRGAAWRQTAGKFSPKTSGRNSPPPVGDAEVSFCCAQSEVVMWQFGKQCKFVKKGENKSYLMYYLYIVCICIYIDIVTLRVESRSPNLICYRLLLPSYPLHSESCSLQAPLKNPIISKEPLFQVVYYVWVLDLAKCLSYPRLVSFLTPTQLSTPCSISKSVVDHFM